MEIIEIDASGNCQVCGKYQEYLHHWGEMCDKCYREWCNSYFKAWGDEK
jgi:ribosomal protein S14